MLKITKHIWPLIGYGLIFSLLGGLATYIYLLNTKFSVEPWHTIDLKEEYTESSKPAVPNYKSYLHLEDRLFQELRDKVFQTSHEKGSRFNRYIAGSLADPFRYEVNYNRSFELPVDNPRGGILMLHGLSDSPYSFRSLAEKMHALGFWVVVPRLPGHGTIPAELRKMKWKDWAAAVDIGSIYVRKQIGPDLPFYIMGYSNGGALAVEYILRIPNENNLPKPEGLILISPEFSLPSIATLAKFQLSLSKLPGLGKLAWQLIMQEYDPFKYNSFPVNAGKQAYSLTKHLQAQLKRSQKSEKLKSFPRVLAFQSIVDATINPEGVTDYFLDRLSPGGHHLVLYDVNQKSLTESLIKDTGQRYKSLLLERENLPFDLTVITNVDQTTHEVQAIHKNSIQPSIKKVKIPYAWPQDIYSLSHVALPFPPDDPVYGNISFANSNHIRLGRILARGEKGVLSIPEKQLMRLRFNPFYTDMVDRITRFIELPTTTP